MKTYLNQAAVLAQKSEETIELIEQLCGIPAPSNHERKRAEFCRDWLTAHGAQGVIIDSAYNTLWPIGCEGSDDIVVLMAHTDTVFPDTEPMDFARDDEWLYAPGVGDDTTCLAILMMTARYIAEHGLTPKRGLLFAANAGEEGLGNLKGIRQIMADYGGRIKEVYTFDGGYGSLVNKCVGSHRYRVTVVTEGGHSFGAFGKPNAIRELSKLVCRLYECPLPRDGESRTTYNVGMISGGTSVNTIAQSAEMMYEYRSDSAACLAEMKRFFENEIARANGEGQAQFTVEVVGMRPCGGDVDEAVLAAMSERCIRVCEKHSGIPCTVGMGSTDCNIPMSMGVPAVCAGLYQGAGAHTREEKVRIASIPIGLKIAAELIAEYFE
ncbi:MAG: M20/M25/M40 family metallo-hydrolase [Clostridia bacterium]|nr:M20/M25/M40 family metallo-hydrolase [Clostridia bacterium]